MVGIKVQGELKSGFEQILTPGALQFLEQLERRFGEKEKRTVTQQKT